MELKTYRAATMAEALAEVKKDLGRDAVILHTRTYKAGGMLGVGARNIVEITASDSAAAGRTSPGPRQRPRRQHAGGAHSASQAASQVRAPAGLAGQTSAIADRAEFTPVVFEPSQASILKASPAGPSSSNPTAASSPEQETGEPPRREITPEPADRAETPSRPVKREPLQRLTERAEIRPVDRRARESLEAELASIKNLVGHVLRASRHTAEAGRGAMPEPLFRHYCSLIDNEVAPELAELVTGAARDELTYAELTDATIVREAVLRQIARRIPAKPMARPESGPRVIALIGPTGVGKTTTVAKLAANFKLRQNKKVGLVTSDTYRIAAVEQLRTYANIIGLPLHVAMTPQEMSSAVRQLSECEVVILDTAGRSQHDAKRLNELQSFLDAGEPTERHLVLSSTISNAVMTAACERFRMLTPDRIVLTKLDEAVHFGPLLNAADRSGLPVSYVTTGQEVPDHIEPASSERLARLVLGTAESETAASGTTEASATA